MDIEGGGCSHYIHIVVVFNKFYQSTTIFFASWVVFLVWPLRGVFFWVVFQYFTLPQLVPRAMQQAWFVFGRMIVPIVCISFLALSSATLLGFLLQFGFSSLVVPDASSTVGIFPINFFRCWSSFVDLFYGFHSFLNIASLFIDFTLEISSLEVGLLGPFIGDGMEHNLVEIQFVHIIALVLPREWRWVVVDLGEPCRKYP